MADGVTRVLDWWCFYSCFCLKKYSSQVLTTYLCHFFESAQNGTFKSMVYCVIVVCGFGCFGVFINECMAIVIVKRDFHGRRKEKCSTTSFRIKAKHYCRKYCTWHTSRYFGAYKLARRRANKRPLKTMLVVADFFPWPRAGERKSNWLFYSVPGTVAG